MAEYLSNARIAFRKDLTPELFIFGVAPDSGAVPEFQPGQYAELAIPEAFPSDVEGLHKKLIRRSYSIASSPEERAFLEFYLVVVPGGLLTPKLALLKPEERLWLGPKIKGKFTLEEVPKGKTLLFISTGTGIAPYISMVRHFGVGTHWKHAIIIHGARLSSDLGYKDELESLSKKRPDITYLPTVTREPEESSWSGLRGRVTSLLDQKKFFELTNHALSPEDCHVLLCGNPDMIDEITETLGQRNFKIHKKKEPGNIHFERYW